MARATVILAIVAGLLLLPPVPAPAEEGAADLYKTYCWQCHGMHGKGNGVNVGDMAVQPRDHTDAQGMAGLTDANLFKAIKEGGPSVNKSVLMPAWGGVLSDAEIHALVGYLRTLCNCKGGS